MPVQIEMARWILEQGREIEGKTFFEVGTGHRPIIPIGFFLSGAKSVITVDLNVRLDYELTQATLLWMAQNRETIEPLYSDFVNMDILKERFALVERLWSEPEVFLKEADIQYLAPADAADTRFPNNSIDYHFGTYPQEGYQGYIC